MQAYTLTFPFAADPEALTPEQVAEFKELETLSEEYKDLKFEDGKTYTAKDMKAAVLTATRQPSPNPLLPATSEIVWGTITFLLVFAALAKFGIPAARKAIDARTAKIEGDLKAAATAKADAEKEGATYRAQIADAKGEGSKIVDEARSQAEAVRKDILARAEAEATDIKAKAIADADAQGDRVKVELQSHVRGLSIDLAEKVVGKNLDRATNEALVDKYISELASN
jgi:F-type H+-transporting ATPase subunit b